jgi:multiple sugar transport system substrate-binding protein
MTMHEDALLRASSRGGWDRRTLLKTFGAGAVAMAGIPLLTACTGGSAPASSGANTATFGSGSSDEVP